jgi:predicted glutamine amidotransferase
VRATTGTAIPQTKCHPFRHGRWLFVHSGTGVLWWTIKWPPRR